MGHVAPIVVPRAQIAPESTTTASSDLRQSPARWQVRLTNQGMLCPFERDHTSFFRCSLRPMTLPDSRRSASTSMAELALLVASSGTGTLSRLLSCRLRGLDSSNWRLVDVAGGTFRRLSSPPRLMIAVNNHAIKRAVAQDAKGHGSGALSMSALTISEAQKGHL